MRAGLGSRPRRCHRRPAAVAHPRRSQSDRQGPPTGLITPIPPDRGRSASFGVISEPQPDPAARELFPDGFQDLSTNPNFLFFVVEVPPSATGSGS
ncbi:hypothetical protein FRAHR75_540041 [Frankia sp. Hr75.2]|nr:hypothetical protein FRAHR75_540041 [Frankia sp. Hr75.2]